MTPIGSFVALRDLMLRVELPTAQRDKVKAVLGTNVAALTPQEAPLFIGTAIETVEECLTFLDREMHRATELKFASADPNTLRQRLLAEPRRQAEQALNALKQRMSSERQEWGRRITKQLSDVQLGLDQQIESIVAIQDGTSRSIELIPEPEWLRAFDAWRADTYGAWASHLSSILPTKTRRAVEGELAAVATILGTTPNTPQPAATPFRLPSGRERAKNYHEAFEIPTAFEAFFETFKDRLNTVAMLAGLVVIPVVGQLMHSAPTAMRAGIMGAAILPIIVFSYLHGRSSRRKLQASNSDKARERLKKAMAQDIKQELERFRLDAERYCGAYCGEAQQTMISALEDALEAHFEALEKRVAKDLASAQVEADRAADALNALRQAKGALTQQLLLELRRRAAEFGSRPPCPAETSAGR